MVDMASKLTWFAVIFLSLLVFLTSHYITISNVLPGFYHYKDSGDTAVNSNLDEISLKRLVDSYVKTKIKTFMQRETSELEHLRTSNVEQGDEREQLNHSDAFVRDDMMDAPFHTTYLHEDYGFITTKCKGRLGNQMFEYASLLGYTLEHPEWRAVLHPESCAALRRVFPKLSITTEELDIESCKEVKLPTNTTLTISTLSRLPGRQNILLNAHMQALIYFHHHMDAVRRDFTFSPEIEQIATEYLRNVTPVDWLGKSYVQVGIHVRRSDQLLERRFNKGIIEHPASYFFHAMDYFLYKYPRVQFVVASEDLSWCRTNLGIRENVVFSGHKAGTDMAILTMCDHIILSIGTFSWWAAWLNPGIKVYYGVLPPNTTEIYQYYQNTFWSKYAQGRWIPIV